MPNSCRQRGFSYIGLLIVVAIVTTGASIAIEASAALQQRAGEEELLAIGAEYRAALESYAAATPFGQPTTPLEWKDLLRDPRQPGVRRHLRRIYADPLSGRSEWGLVRSPDGRIAGIHSLSRTETWKRADFPPGMEHFVRAQRHDEWVFAPLPVQTARTAR
jgi:type II secretory pathway pseudopilin PulG